MFFKIIWNEFVKEIFCAWGYKINWIGELITLALFFMFLSNMTYEHQNKGIEYCIWFYSVLVTGEIGNKLSSEMKNGTLEQVYLSIFPTWFLFFVKIISSTVKSMLIVFVLLIFMYVLGFVDTNYFCFFKLFFLLILITPCLFGISFVFGGLTLVFRDISWLTNLFNNYSIFLSGIFVPLDKIPAWMHVLVYNNIVYVGVGILREEQNLIICMRLIFYCFLIFLFGLIFFIYCQNKVKTNGTLGYY